MRPAAVAQAPIHVALVGNPNTGKSTLFSVLAGVRQRVGNYPGVTVEKKIGQMTHEGRRYAVVDLPGTYSLAPRSLDEMVAVDVLLGRQSDTPPPDVVICIVDASNLERNLYLVSQVLELELPTVIALNMVDVARDKGITLDVARLRERLGVPVVEIQAHRRLGIDALKQALAETVGRSVRAPASPFPPAFLDEVRQLHEQLAGGNGALPRYLVERLLLDTAGYLEGHLLAHHQPTARQAIAEARSRLTAAGLPVPAVEAMSRYQWVGTILTGVVTRPAARLVTWSDRVDQVLTHRVWGTVVFATLMAVVFQSVFTLAAWPMDWIDAGFAALGDACRAVLPAGAVADLVVDGIIGGVGGVIVFLPQILILFLFIGVLEDCGYMTRAAYLMDKLMTRVGLSGKSFIPMLSSFACAIPGIMATRVIENRRDRLTTILVAPLMSCSARLPVYTLLISAFIPNTGWLGGWLKLQTLVMMSMYVLGIVAAAGVALVLKRTLLRGPTPPFVMELPSYKWPSPRTVAWRMIDRGWSFIRRAGTLIVVVSILVWAALYYPRNTEQVEAPFRDRQAALAERLSQLAPDDPARRGVEAEQAWVERLIAGAHQRQSLLGRVGHWIEPAVKPLGWDWRIGCAVVASFPAREVVVATLGILYDVGGDVDVADEQQRTQLERALAEATWEGTDRPVFTIPTALSIMVFFSLCAQCAATLAVIRRETNSWGWPAFTFGYMTALAYLAALVTYQGTAWLIGV